jgi:hypothetical protein
VSKRLPCGPGVCNFLLDPTASSNLWNIETFDSGSGCQPDIAGCDRIRNQPADGSNKNGIIQITHIFKNYSFDK